MITRTWSRTSWRTSLLKSNSSSSARINSGSSGNSLLGFRRLVTILDWDPNTKTWLKIGLCWSRNTNTVSKSTTSTWASTFSCQSLRFWLLLNGMAAMWFYREVSFRIRLHSGPPSEWTLLRTRLNKIVSEHHILRISRCQAKNSILNGRTRYKMTTRWWRATFYTNLKFNREWSTWLKCHLMANWPIKNWLHKIKWTIIIWSAFYNCINCHLRSWNTQEKRRFNKF